MKGSVSPWSAPARPAADFGSKWRATVLTGTCSDSTNSVNAMATTPSDRARRRSTPGASSGGSRTLMLSPFGWGPPSLHLHLFKVPLVPVDELLLGQQ